MIMLIQLLGPKYIVWGKAATIRFRRPGRDLVDAAGTEEGTCYGTPARGVRSNARTRRSRRGFQSRSLRTA